jgi:hypothetical protein
MTEIATTAPEAATSASPAGITGGVSSVRSGELETCAASAVALSTELVATAAAAEVALHEGVVRGDGDGGVGLKEDAQPREEQV